jgi:peptidoglycan/LPS O-acetylase OafA/YrhL
MTSTKHYVPALDAIRGIAIFGVFLVHSLETAFGFSGLQWNGLFRDFATSKAFLLLYPLTYGHGGVAVFFVVSGFCIHLSHATSSNKRWSYFANRRFFRIYPPYLFALLVFFFVWPKTWAPVSIFSFAGIAQLGTHLFAIHNLDERTLYGINPSFWSIAVELQLYAIYPLLVWLITRLGWGRAIAVAAFLELSIRGCDAYHSVFLGERLPYWIKYSPFAYWLSWSMGAFVAKCYINDESSLFTRMSPPLLAIVAFGTPLFRPTAAFYFVAVALLTSAVIAQIVAGRIRLDPENLFCRHFSRLGVVSFSFYLIHQPILFLFPYYIRPAFPYLNIHPLVSLLCLLLFYPVILWASKLMFDYVELPSVSLGRAFWSWRAIANHTMQPSGEVGSIEMVDHSSPPVVR